MQLQPCAGAPTDPLDLELAEQGGGRACFPVNTHISEQQLQQLHSGIRPLQAPLEARPPLVPQVQAFPASPLSFEGPLAASAPCSSRAASRSAPGMSSQLDEDCRTCCVERDEQEREEEPGEGGLGRDEDDEIQEEGVGGPGGAQPEPDSASSVGIRTLIGRAQNRMTEARQQQQQHQYRNSRGAQLVRYAEQVARLEGGGEVRTTRGLDPANRARLGINRLVVPTQNECIKGRGAQCKGTQSRQRQCFGERLIGWDYEIDAEESLVAQPLFPY